MKNYLASGLTGLLSIFAILIASPAQATDCLDGLAERNPTSIYLNHGDGTVTDVRTGLMWKRCAEGFLFSSGRCQNGDALRFRRWGEALTHADSSGFAGYRDWRLPNVKELSSLVEDCKPSPAINSNIFLINVSEIGHIDFQDPWSGLVWSSSPAGQELKWIVNFGTGGTQRHHRLAAEIMPPRVLLVRDPND